MSRTRHAALDQITALAPLLSRQIATLQNNL